MPWALRSLAMSTFLSTPSARRATEPVPPRIHGGGYFYPRPPRGGRLGQAVHGSAQAAISIHALREEGDSDRPFTAPPKQQFLSTPSARRATNLNAVLVSHAGISIHALREEGDVPRRSPCCAYHNFYPRPPRGGRHFVKNFIGQSQSISIHALREEGDRRTGAHGSGYADFYPRPPRGGRRRTRCHNRLHRRYFYPRPPRGGRLSFSSSYSGSEVFLSTPSARRATQLRHILPDAPDISIHALREEGDCGSPAPGRIPP